MNVTDSPIYVIRDTPQAPQQLPRIDVLDFAVRLASGTNDELSITKALTEGIFSPKSGFLYNPDADELHTDEKRFDLTGATMEFTVSNFIPGQPGIDINPEGDCRDFSNLFQTCGAALGVPAKIRRIYGCLFPELMAVTKLGLYINPVRPVGYDDFVPTFNRLCFHQTGFMPDLGTIYDPTYELRLNKDDPVPDPSPQPILPVNMSEATYKNLLRNSNVTNVTDADNLYIVQKDAVPSEVK